MLFGPLVEIIVVAGMVSHVTDKQTETVIVGQNIEIIPPEEDEARRDSRGRFGEGNNAGGRKAGSVNITTRQLRATIMEALNNASGGDGGVMYFTMLALSKPEVFAGIVAKCLPIKLVGDDEGQGLVVTRIERVIIDPAK